jgi:hypothetical protein
MLILRPLDLLTPLTSGKLAGKLWNPTSPSGTIDTPSTITHNGNEARKQVQEAAIDPLSQVCTHLVLDARNRNCRRLIGIFVALQQILQRTNTTGATQKLQGLRTQTTDIVAGGSPTSPNESYMEQAKAAGAEAARQARDGEGKDKK